VGDTADGQSVREEQLVQRALHMGQSPSRSEFNAGRSKIEVGFGAQSSEQRQCAHVFQRWCLCLLRVGWDGTHCEWVHVCQRWTIRRVGSGEDVEVGTGASDRTRFCAEAIVDVGPVP